MSFMRWQAARGVLRPLDRTPAGSLWWRAVNDRLLSDGCESMARPAGLVGEPSSPAIELWMSFIAAPTARNWYRAHNASIVSAYLDNRDLAELESLPERFFLNVALLRVLFAHALVAAPRLAVGRYAPLGRILGDPRLGWPERSCRLAACFRTGTRSEAIWRSILSTSTAWGGRWTTA